MNRTTTKHLSLTPQLTVGDVWLRINLITENCIGYSMYARTTKVTRTHKNTTAHTRPYKRRKESKMYIDSTHVY